MTLLINCVKLFYTFFKIGFFGFGGGYAMLSMIMMESGKMGVTAQQLADLTALDMIVPGPIAINAATYVGYLYSGFWGALAATVAVSAPSFIFVAVTMHFIEKYRNSNALNGVLKGVKPAAVGLIAAASMMIASGIIFKTGKDISTLFSDPLGTVSLFMAGIFAATAIANIRFKINPILLTVLAGAIGAIFLQ